MKKHTIAVLFGGCSPEYGVSLQSAYSVISHIDTAKFAVLPLGITRSGEWYLFSGSLEKIKDDTWHNPADCARAIISPDRGIHGVLVCDTDACRVIRLDAAMPILHGKNGEDGTVQGLLELADIPIVGCGTLASALCMDKDKAHKIAATAGVRVPRSFTLKAPAAVTSYREQAEKLGYPLFVKPVNAGSSFGISKVGDEKALPAAVELAFSFDGEIIIEENIVGAEVGCAILGGESLSVGAVDEIELADGFFDHKEKYSLETSSIHIPARIRAEKAAEVKETAITIYKALGCSGFAWVDMFLTPCGEIVFNEVNTVPGFTAHSRYPRMLAATGMTFERVVNTAIALALKG